MSGDYTGMLRIVECSRKYNGAFPLWMGPTDANLMTVHPTIVKYVLSGSGKQIISLSVGVFLYTTGIPTGFHLG
jgi:hypothetical protein